MSYREEAYESKPLSARIIDAHTHITEFYRNGWHQMKEHTTLADFIATYDRLGIDCCVTAPHPLVDGMTTLANELAAAAAKEYPGRIYGYISVSPCEGMDSLKRSLAQYGKDPAFVGCKFLGGYNGDYTEEAYQYALGFANEVKCPVLCHTWGNNPSHDTMRGMLEKFPDFTLVCAHLGGGTEELTRKAAQIVRAYPNFYLELCGSLGNKLGVADVVELIGAERLIFGTDVLNLDARFDFGRVAFAPIPDAQKDLIFSGNYLRLLARSQMGKITL